MCVLLPEPLSSLMLSFRSGLFTFGVVVRAWAWVCMLSVRLLRIIFIQFRITLGSITFICVKRTQWMQAPANRATINWITVWFDGNESTFMYNKRQSKLPSNRLMLILLSNVLRAPSSIWQKVRLGEFSSFFSFSFLVFRCLFLNPIFRLHEWLLPQEKYFF